MSPRARSLREPNVRRPSWGHVPSWCWGTGKTGGVIKTGTRRCCPKSDLLSVTPQMSPDTPSLPRWPPETLH